MRTLRTYSLNFQIYRRAVLNIVIMLYITPLVLIYTFYIGVIYKPCVLLQILWEEKAKMEWFARDWLEEKGRKAQKVGKNFSDHINKKGG